MYVKHQRTLHQKRVSKGNAKAKAKSPPMADDSASNVSIESHVSVPVVILPLDSQSVNIDDNLSNIQNIDNVVEIQQPQPEVPPPPPPPSVVFDAGTIASVFDRLHSLLSKFEGSSTPQIENVGSVRKSSTAGPSDNARLNPLTQVADSAPRVLMRPLDLQRLCMSLLPRVLAILLPKNLANYLLLVLGRTVGSRFALDV